MSLPVCDRCGHLVADHTRKTKYSDRACNKKDKHLAKIHKETREHTTINEIAGSLMLCICDGLVVSATGDAAFEREKVEFMAQAEMNRR